ncbi:MAG: riboflavin synthase [Gemmatimonadota bacterium]|nr:riboflavin synthase [Gemmatimonadota bacterium]
MFTGLIEAVGTVAAIGKTGAGVEVTIEGPWRDLADGESIAVNGVCLTVREIHGTEFKVAAMVMTTSRTTVGNWLPGRRLNLERAMRADSRFGGHIVQGHVDGVGVVLATRQEQDTLLLDVSIPEGLRETLILHGSVTIDGVSLTVNRLESDKLQVALIEFTLRHTALNELGEGAQVNIETDVIGKYVRGLLTPYLKR